LQNMAVDLNRVRSEVERITPKGEKVVQQGISYTPRAKRVVELAIEESQNLGHNYVGTEHLMYGHGFKTCPQGSNRAAWR